MITLRVKEYANANVINFYKAGAQYHSKELDHSFSVQDYVDYMKEFYSALGIEVSGEVVYETA